MAATAIHIRFLTRRVSLDTSLIVLVATFGSSFRGTFDLGVPDEFERMPDDRHPKSPKSLIGGFSL
jgi:hypothetical protein